MARVLSIVSANGQRSDSYKAFQLHLQRLRQQQPGKMDEMLDLFTSYLALILDGLEMNGRVDDAPLSREACLARVEATLAAISRAQRPR